MSKIGQISLFAFFVVSNARAQDCNQDHLCVGDHTWVCTDGQCDPVEINYVLAGSVMLKFPTSDIPIKFDDSNVVITKDLSCLPNGPIKACKGSFTQRKVLSQYRSGEIVGFTPDGLLAIMEGGDAPVTVSPKEITKVLDQPCVPVLGDCPGDRVFVENKGKLELITLDKINLQSGTWRSKDEEGNLSQIASIKRDACSEDKNGYSICPGAPVRLNNMLGMVLGGFADGTLIVSTPKGNVQTAVSSELVRQSVSGDEEKQIAAGLSGIANINEILNVQQWKDCAGPPPIAPREKIPAPSLNCAEENNPIGGDDSPNKAKFEALLRKGMSTPLDKFLMLWYPDRGGDGLDRDSSYFSCETNEDGNFDHLGATCQPDILYSWGPPEKRESILSSLADGDQWQGKGNKNHTIFTSISAASTLDYGKVLMRFKIRRSANFVLEQEGWASPQKNMVAVRKDFAHDFNFNDTSVVDSVSTGTPEIYDEVVRDILHFKSGKRVSVYSEWYLGLGKYPNYEKLFTQHIDEHGFNEDTVKAALLELIREILAGEGTIHYRQGTCRNRNLNFSTENPNYIQPIKSPK